MLELASLCEPEIPLAFLREAGAGDAALTTLLDRGELIPAARPGHLRFAATASRTRLAREIPWSRRRQYHERLARSAVRHRLAPEWIARHFTEAHCLPEARQYWLRAGEQACAARDYAAALRCIEQALNVWPWSEDASDRLRVLREMARCALNARQPELARKAWEEIGDYARESCQPALRVEALSQLALHHPDITECGRLLRETARLAGDALPPAEAARHWLNYTDHLATRVRVRLGGEALAEAARFAKKAKDPALDSEILGWQGLLAAMAGRRAEAEQRIDQSLRIATRHNLTEQTALAYRRRANICEYLGDYPGERDHHLKAIGFCEREGASGAQTCLGCLAYAQFRTGDWKEALQTARQLTAEPEQVHSALLGIAETTQGLVHTFRGERRPGERQLTAGLEKLRRHGAVGLEFFSLWGLAFGRECEGEWERAGETYDEVRALWQETDDLHDVLPAMLSAGLFYALRRDAARLADCIDIVGSVRKKNPLPEALAADGALSGISLFLEGKATEALAALDRSERGYAACSLPLEQLLVARERARISAPLDGTADFSEARKLAARLGARPLMTPFTAGPTHGSQCDLTPRQLEVLRFLADGLTSKEIADRLSLSTRTIEMHVGRLLARLNCRTRPEAVRTASERGWI